MTTYRIMFHDNSGLYVVDPVEMKGQCGFVIPRVGEFVGDTNNRIGRVQSITYKYAKNLVQIFVVLEEPK